MENKLSALFGRKMNNLCELLEATYVAKRSGQRGVSYEITKEIVLGEKEFGAFSQDFFKDQPWIEKDDGGLNANGAIRCIRVTNTQTKERILVNSEGYQYCRYTAIED